MVWGSVNKQKKILRRSFVDSRYADRSGLYSIIWIRIHRSCITLLRYLYFGQERSSSVNPNSIGVEGGGQDRPCDAKFSEKYPCSHHNNTALI